MLKWLVGQLCLHDLWDCKTYDKASDGLQWMNLVLDFPWVPHNLCWPHTGFSASTMTLDFRLPRISFTAPSSTMDHQDNTKHLPTKMNEETPLVQPQPLDYDSNMSQENSHYKEEGLKALRAFKEMLSNDTNWNVASTLSGATLYTKDIDSRKVWKVEGVLPIPAHCLFNLLHPGENLPEWSTTCALNQIVHRVDDTTDLFYTITSSRGPFSSRDFLSVRHIEIDGDCYYSASQAVISSMKPEQPGKVRGENGPGGYLVVPLNRNQSKLIWVINTNPKVWLLPQALVNHTLTYIFTSSFAKLQVYVKQQNRSSNCHN